MSSTISLSTTRTITPFGLPTQQTFQQASVTGGKQVVSYIVITGTSGTPGTVSCFPGLVDASLSQGTANYIEIQNLDVTNAVTLNMRDGTASPVSSTLILAAGGTARAVFYNVSMGVAKAAAATWAPNWQLTGTALSPVSVTIAYG